MKFKKLKKANFTPHLGQKASYPKCKIVEHTVVVFFKLMVAYYVTVDTFFLCTISLVVFLPPFILKNKHGLIGTKL